MPPSYTPLPITQADKPSSLFSTVHPDYTDYAKTQAALLAQRLANENNQITLQNNQVAQEQQNAVREAMKSVYANKDPNDMAQMDPEAGLRAAQSEYLKQGDPLSATTIQRAVRESDTYKPYGDAELESLSRSLGIPLPKGSTPAFVNQMIQGGRAVAYSDQVQFGQDRYNRGIESLAPGGYKAKIDPVTGQGPTKEDGKLFTKTVKTHSDIQNKLNELELSFNRSDPNNPNAPEYIKQKGILGEIQTALKEKNGFGANLAGNEEKLNNATLPEVYARPDMTIGKALISQGFGRDPVEALKNLRGLLNQDLASQEFIYKFTRDDPYRETLSNPPATQEVTRQLQTQDPNALAQKLAPQPMNDGLPRNADGSLIRGLSEADFLQRLQQQGN